VTNAEPVHAREVALGPPPAPLWPTPFQRQRRLLPAPLGTVWWQSWDSSPMSSPASSSGAMAPRASRPSPPSSLLWSPRALTDRPRVSSCASLSRGTLPAPSWPCQTESPHFAISGVAGCSRSTPWRALHPLGWEHRQGGGPVRLPGPLRATRGDEPFRACPKFHHQGSSGPALGGRHGRLWLAPAEAPADGTSSCLSEPPGGVGPALASRRADTSDTPALIRKTHGRTRPVT
jgi:hypothetical protein